MLLVLAPYFELAFGIPRSRVNIPTISIDSSRHHVVSARNLRMSALKEAENVPLNSQTGYHDINDQVKHQQTYHSANLVALIVAVASMSDVPTFGIGC